MLTMVMKYHYEFDNIQHMKNIHYIITLPSLNNAIWVPDVYCYFIRKTTVKIFIKDSLLDERSIFAETRWLLNRLNNCENTFICAKNNTNTGMIKLWPGNIYNDFNYLFLVISVHHKVTVDVEITTNPSIEEICIQNNENKPYIEGEFVVKEVTI